MHLSMVGDLIDYHTKAHILSSNLEQLRQKCNIDDIELLTQSVCLHNNGLSNNNLRNLKKALLANERGKFL